MGLSPCTEGLSINRESVADPGCSLTRGRSGVIMHLWCQMSQSTSPNPVDSPERRTEMLIGKLPRTRLATLPTPLEFAPRLTEVLGGPRIWLKRDDLTGLGMGGNKARKLEFILAMALAEGADVVVTGAAKQSNHCRLTAAAACKLGLGCVLLLRGDPPAQRMTGNLLLDTIYGARIKYVGDVPWWQLQPLLEETCEELMGQGMKPFAIPSGGATAVGSTGYVLAAAETCDQMYELGLAAGHVLCACGSAGTLAGLVTGAKALSAGFSVQGFSVDLPCDEVQRRALVLAQETAELLGAECTVTEDDVLVSDEYIGEAYGVPSAGGMEAIDLVARTEGVLLDPVYTGKAMAGLIDQIRSGRFERSEDVIFLHTGGAPALFAYEDALRTWQETHPAFALLPEASEAAAMGCKQEAPDEVEGSATGGAFGEGT
jgi:L-cysteate sulfo-lyase